MKPLPKAQRAFACYDGPWPNLPMTPTGNTREIPVLVIPEAAVRGCRHEATVSCDALEVCQDCGAWRRWVKGRLERWQLPAILRVPRERKEG